MDARLDRMDDRLSGVETAVTRIQCQPISVTNTVAGRFSAYLMAQDRTLARRARPREYVTPRRRLVIAPLVLLLVVVTAQACMAGAPTDKALRAEVVAALDSLAAEVSVDRPANAAAYTERLLAYLESHPSFFGAAAALLDRAGTVTTSPYIYRTADGYLTRDLAVSTYVIEAQAWVTAPLAANAGVWTAPYFDAGGGEIWMVTRAVPVRDADGVFAILTTDLPVEPPAQ